MKTTNFFLIYLICGILRAQGPVPIKPSIFGQNAWYINVNLTTNFSTAFDAAIDDVKVSGAKYVRIGGIDLNFKPLYDISGTTLGLTTRLEHKCYSIKRYGANYTSWI